jgi:hypothetical protein
MYDPDHAELFKQLSEARDDGDESLYEELRIKALTGGIDWRRNDLIARLEREFPPYGIEPVRPAASPEFDPEFDREAALKEALDKGDDAELVRISEQYPADTPAGIE